MCKKQSNFAQDLPNDSYFSNDESNEDELRFVAKLFREQGRLTSVLRLSLLDLHSAPDRADFEKQLQEYDFVCEKVVASKLPSDIHRVLAAQLSLCSLLVSKDIHQDARCRLQKCKELLGNLEGQGLSCPSATFQVQMLDYKLNLPSDLYERAVGYGKLADLALANRDYPRVRQNLINSGITSRESFRAGAKDLKKEQEYYHYTIIRRLQLEKDIMKSAFWVGITLEHFGLPFLALGKSKEYMKYVKDFLTENRSTFKLPFVMATIAGHAENNAGRIGDRVNKKNFRELKQEFQPQCPYAMKRSDGKFVLTREAALSSEYCQLEIVDDDNQVMLENTVRVCLNWAAMEASAGRLSSADFPAMFGTDSMSVDDFASQYETPIFIGEEITALQKQVVEKLYGSREFPAPESEWSTHADVLESWLRQRCQASFEEARHFTLKMLLLSRLFSLRQKVADVFSQAGAKVSDDLYEALIKANERKIRILESIVPAARGVDDPIMAKQNLMEGIVILSNSQTAIASGRLTDQMLQEHMEVLGKTVCDHYRAVGRLEWLHMNLRSRGYVAFRRNQLFNSIEPDASMVFYEEADQIYCKMRRNAAASQFEKDLDASDFRAKQAQTQQLMQPIVYMSAIVGCVGAYRKALSTREADGSPEAEDVVRRKAAQLSLWIERSKARTLLDEMGIGARIPKRLLAISTTRSSYQNFLTDEQRLLSQLEAAGAAHRPAEEMKYREELQQLRGRMESEVSMHEIVALRDGTPATQADIESMLTRIGPNVALVSYFYLGGVEIWIAIYRSAQPPIFSQINLSVATIKKWAKENLAQDKPLNTDDSWTTLAELDPLVEAIGANTRPGDTIVLCPTKDLYNIPLHLLSYSSDLLIERNPVLYCQSLSVLQRCKLNVDEVAKEATMTCKGAILNPLQESMQSPALLSQLEKLLNTRAISESYISAQQAIAAMTDATMIFYHGHCDFLENPAEQSLRLDDLHKPSQEKFTTEQIFQVALHAAALVVLVACRSGSSHSKDTDDLFGLSTAFLYAGATSVVSTLWAIDNMDGILFGRLFYANLEKAKELKNSEGSRVRDLAKVLQETLLELGKEEAASSGRRTPYHWGAFTLNGFWQMPAAFVKWDPTASLESMRIE